KRRLDVPTLFRKSAEGGLAAPLSAPLSQTNREGWLLFSSGSSASVFWPFLPTRRRIMIAFPNPTRREWIWPWRSSAPMPAFCTIFSSSKVWKSPNLRYSSVFFFIFLMIDVQRRIRRKFLGNSFNIDASLPPQPGFDVKYIYHNFYLKATKCQKGTVDSSGCKFRNDRVRSFLCSDFPAHRKPGNLECGSGGACSDMLLLFCLCAFMQPLIDCVTCYKTFIGEIEEQPNPYVHCVHRPALTEVRLTFLDLYD
ncbi:hypothetical protein ILYODFUR_034116, partial [Ilyodon furcidens]